jgi:hypothetical protein
MTTQSFMYDTVGPYLLKDPDANLDYSFNWVDWLAGDTIASAAVTVTGATKGATTNTTSAVTVWISGGTAGQIASVACKITTAGGRIDERTIRLKITPR